MQIVSSKAIPKEKPQTGKPIGITGIGILLLFILSLGFLIWKIPVSLFVILIVIVYIAVILFFLNWKIRKKLNRVKLKRGSYDIGKFARYFNCREVDTWIIRSVYEAIVDFISMDIDDFPLHPDDDLFKLIEIDYDDLEIDMLPMMAKRCKRSIDDTVNNPLYGNVNTVKDLILFLNYQPKCNT